MASVSTKSEPAVDEFVKALKRRMDETGMSHADLAKKARIGRPYLYRVLSGEQTPSLDWAAKVGREVGLRIRTVKA